MFQQQIVQSGTTMENYKYGHTMIKGLLKGVDDSNDDIIDRAFQSSKEVY